MDVSDQGGVPRARIGDEQRVTPLELFFDLVFVFALTQVTGFLSNHLTFFTAMAAMFVASLAVPSAFGHYGVLFGLAYFVVVQTLQVLLYALATGDTPEQRRAILRLAPGFVGGPALLIVAGFLDGYAQGALWAVALAVGYGVALIRGVSGFRIHAGHFAERHGLVVIIALGESIVAAGVGVSGLALGVGVLVAVVVGIALAAALWWAYFDLVMLVAERRLFAAKGEERARLARDAYPYLHLPMVAGIIFVALGIKQTLAHVGDPLGTIPAVALCGGVALYLVGHNAFRLREVGSVSVPRLVVTVLCLALIPLAVSIPSLVILAVLAGLMCALVAFETMRSREFRRELRAQ
jgi:low temperature requirement protein LtrA